MKKKSVANSEKLKQIQTSERLGRFSGGLVCQQSWRIKRLSDKVDNIFGLVRVLDYEHQNDETNQHDNEDENVADRLSSFYYLDS